MATCELVKEYDAEDTAIRKVMFMETRRVTAGASKIKTRNRGYLVTWCMRLVLTL